MCLCNASLTATLDDIVLGALHPGHQGPLICHGVPEYINKNVIHIIIIIIIRMMMINFHESAFLHPLAATKYEANSCLALACSGQTF